MTSREHARRLMLILLSSQGAPESGADAPWDDGGEQRDDGQVVDGLDDSAEADERPTAARVEALAVA